VTICSLGGKKGASLDIRPGITTIYCLKPLKGHFNLLALLKGFNRQREVKKGRGWSNRRGTTSQIFVFLAEEQSSGKVNFRGCPCQQSSQRKQVEPFETVTEAMPLNLSRTFKMSFHQKDPF